MRRVRLPSVGTSKPSRRVWRGLKLGEPWNSLVEFVAPGSKPTDIQVKSLKDAKLLTSRRNLVISGPTNSGKSLLAYMALIRGALQGKRALLIEPLRAIAQEKHAELTDVLTKLEPTLGKSISVTITTGDYRLDEETMQSPPPDTGEVVIATPERIEAILRNPDFDPWMESFAVVVVDEAHLLSDRIRGATLEYVITSMKTMQRPPRIVLLSATLGDTRLLESWLDPCDVAHSSGRFPALSREIIQVAKEEEPKATVIEIVRSILKDSEASLLIFVYQTAWADALARELTEVLFDLCGEQGALGYHSKLRSETKERYRADFMNGRSRCVVTTTALAMGVNFPATHVLIRDLTQGPGKPIGIGTLVQMAGRAGRGTREGHAIFLHKPSDTWELEALQGELESLTIPQLRSTLVSRGLGLDWNGRDDDHGKEPRLAELVLSLLGRHCESGLTPEALNHFVSNTMEGGEAIAEIQAALVWLSRPGFVLAYQDKAEQWKPTVLGTTTIRASMDLTAAAGVANLLRDLLSVDSDDKLIGRLEMLDLLLLTELVATRTAVTKRFSKDLGEQVDGWIDRSDAKPAMFTEWIRGTKDHSKADEVFGSLGIMPNKSAGRGNAPEKARQFAYLATMRSIVLWQRANGIRSEDLERRWKLSGLAEAEQTWRDDRLFLLAGMSKLFEIRCIFYHLKEECGASDERIQRVKRILADLATSCHQLMNMLGWCSPLGPIFVRLRRTQSKAGKALPAKATMAQLEQGGFDSAERLAKVSLDDLRRLGVRKDLAKLIVGFMRRS